MEDAPAVSFSEADGAWKILRYREIAQMLSDERATVRPPGSLVPIALQGSEAGAIFGHLARMNDGRSHRRLRQPIDELMATSFEVGALGGLVESEIDRLTAGCHDGAAVDLMRLAYRLPVLAVCRLLGMSDAISAVVLENLGDFVPALVPWSSGSEIERANDTTIRLRSALVPFLEEPGGAVQEALSTLSAGERVATLIGVLAQSYEATAALIGNALRRALSRPTCVSSTPGAFALCQEVLRFDAPVQSTRRVLRGEMELGGATLPKGANVVLLIAAGNRDPAVYAHPDSFDPDRYRNRSAAPPLTFGSGPHRCPGRDVALSVAAAAVRGLIDRFPDCVLEQRSTEYRPAPNLRLPVSLAARLR